MTVTPVLADQLEADGVGERLLEFCRALSDRVVRGRRRRTSSRAARGRVRGRGASATARRSAHLEALDGDLLRLFVGAGRRGPGRAARLGGHPRGAAAARHPRRAARCSSTPACARTGAASATGAGFWLPECAYEPGLERLLAEHGRRATSASTRAPTSRRLAALAPVATGAGPVAFTIDWETVQWLWSLDGYPSDPRLRRLPPQVAARRPAVGDRRRAPTTRSAAEARAREHGREFARRGGRGGWRGSRPSAAAAGCSCSRSTRSCSATGGGRGRRGSRRCSRRPPSTGSSW